MPAFFKLPVEGHLEFIGYVKNRADDLKSSALLEAMLSFDGIEGEDHGGATRPSCSRVSMMYEKGTPIANARQVSVMSKEEIDEITHLTGLKNNLPEWWGASLVIKGIPNFSALPPSSRIQFSSGATIRVDVENGPCIYAAREIEENTGTDARLVLEAAKNRRGVVGSVEREGKIKIGDTIRVFVPNARAFSMPQSEGNS